MAVMHVLFSYDFWVVVNGATLLTVIAAVIDCFNVYQGQGLTGNALERISYPDVVLFLMLFRTQDPLILCLGTATSAAVSYALILWSQGEKKLTPDAVFATMLAGIFGLEMILKTFIQSSPAFRNASQSGLRVYIFGSAAFMTKWGVWLLLLGALLLADLLCFFRQSLQHSSFDPGYAASLNIPERLMGTVMLCLTIAIITLGIRTIGTVLTSAFLLLPCVVASRYAKTLSAVLRFAVAMAVCSALLGCAVSTSMAGISTGPMIIVCVGVLTLAAFLFRLGKERG